MSLGGSWILKQVRKDCSQNKGGDNRKGERKKGRQTRGTEQEKRKGGDLNYVAKKPTVKKTSGNTKKKGKGPRLVRQNERS